MEKSHQAMVAFQYCVFGLHKTGFKLHYVLNLAILIRHPLPLTLHFLHSIFFMEHLGLEYFRHAGFIPQQVAKLKYLYIEGNK